MDDNTKREGLETETARLRAAMQSLFEKRARELGCEADACGSDRDHERAHLSGMAMGLLEAARLITADTANKGKECPVCLGYKKLPDYLGGGSCDHCAGTGSINKPSVKSEVCTCSRRLGDYCPTTDDNCPKHGTGSTTKSSDKGVVCPKCRGRCWDWQYTPEMGRTEMKMKCQVCSGTGRVKGGK